MRRRRLVNKRHVGNGNERFREAMIIGEARKLGNESPWEMNSSLGMTESIFAWVTMAPLLILLGLARPPTMIIGTRHASKDPDRVTNLESLMSCSHVATL